jgi:hypothetical protein
MLVMVLAAAVLGICTSLYKPLLEPWWWETYQLDNPPRKPLALAYPHLWFGIVAAFALLLAAPRGPRWLVSLGGTGDVPDLSTRVWFSETS